MRSFGRLPRLKHMTCGAAVTSEHCHLFILTMSLAVYLGHMHVYIISCIHSISFIAFEFVYFVIFTSGAFLFFFYRILYLRVKSKSNRSVTYPDLDSICVSSWIRCWLKTNDSVIAWNCCESGCYSFLTKFYI